MTDRRTSPLTKAFAWFAVIIGVLIIWGAVQGQREHAGKTQEAHAKRAAMHAQPQDRSDDGLALEACAAAQEAVKAKLKAPASAKFPGCAFGAHEYRIRANESRDTVWVMGHVDAQNAMGAMLRSDFGVKLERVGGELVPVQVAMER